METIKFSLNNLVCVPLVPLEDRKTKIKQNKNVIRIAKGDTGSMYPQLLPQA